jgi:hypothetical protein
MIGWYHTHPKMQMSQRRPLRARRETLGAMFMVECHRPVLLRPPPGGPPREAVGQCCHRGVGSVFSNTPIASQREFIYLKSFFPGLPAGAGAGCV